MVDWVEVSRVSYQLGIDHGQNAHLYATKLAAEAAAEKKVDEAEFWKAVAAALTPRTSGSES